jgi:hypothetical protein
MTLRRIFSNSIETGAIDSTKIASASITDQKIFKFDIPRISNVIVSTPDFTPSGNANISFRNNPGFCIIEGTNIQPGAQVFTEKIPYGQVSNLVDSFILASNITYNSTSNIFVSFPTLTAGYYNVYVVNPDSGVGMRVVPFGVSYDPPLFIEILAVAGGGGGGGDDSSPLDFGQAGAGGAGIYASTTIPINTNFFVGVGGGGNGGSSDTAANQIPVQASGGPGGTLGGGQGGDAGETGTAGGGGGGGGYSSFSSPTNILFKIGGGGGGGGGGAGNANGRKVLGGGHTFNGTTGSDQGGNGANFGVPEGGGYGGGGGGYQGGLAGNDIFGSNGGSNFAEDSLVEYYTFFLGSNTEVGVSTASNSAAFDSFITNGFNYSNGIYGNGGANVRPGTQGVVYIKYAGTKRLATGGQYYLYAGNSFHRFSNVGIETFVVDLL